MWGNTGHLAALEHAIKDKYSEPNEDGEELETMLPTTNENVATYDGIDWGGERVAHEVRHCPHLTVSSGLTLTHCGLGL